MIIERIKIRAVSIAMLLTAACAAKPESPAAEKTFATLMRCAVFLKDGHEAYRAFDDSDLKVIRVTSLNRSGEGSLAWAVGQDGPRIIVFEVGGVIDMDKSTLNIRNPWLFIAGQTAPAPGITLVRGGLNIRTHDVVIQHIAVRPGDCGLPPASGWEADGLSTIGACNVLVDHCSFTWATDENLSASGPRHEGADRTSSNITFSNCIIAEGLFRSTHSKVTHSMGTLIHDYCRNIAVTGNLFAHNNQRNPMLKPNATAFVANNVIYNPRDKAIHAAWPVNEYADYPDSLRRAKLSAIGNVLIPGADTKQDMYPIYGKMSVYPEDNTVIRNAGDKTGIRSGIVSPETEVLAQQPVHPGRYTAIRSENVVAHVLKNVGSRPGTRDAIDRRIIDGVSNGEGKVINSQDEVGGYPVLVITQRRLSVPGKNIEKWLEELGN